MSGVWADALVDEPLTISDTHYMVQLTLVNILCAHKMHIVKIGALDKNSNSGWSL